MSGPRPAHHVPLILVGALVALVSAVGTSAAAPSPEAVRSCIEGNLVRYSDPATAVAAQYADIETACRAGLEDGSVTAEFEPEGAPAARPTTTDRPADPPEEDPAGTPGPSQPGRAAQSPSTAPGRSPEPAATPAAASPNRLVAESLAGGEAGAGAPVPATLSGGSMGMTLLFGGIVLTILGAVVVAIRRRPS